MKQTRKKTILRRQRVTESSSYQMKEGDTDIYIVRSRTKRIYRDWLRRRVVFKFEPGQEKMEASWGGGW